MDAKRENPMESTSRRLEKYPLLASTIASLSTLRGNFVRTKRNSNMFFFLGLPILSTKKVIRAMDPKERILLALTSKRMEEYVHLARIKIPLSVVHLREKCTTINFFDEKLTLYCNGGAWFSPKVEESISRNQLKPWINTSSTSLIEKTGDILNRIEDTFLCDRIALVFCERYKNKKTVKQVLENSSLKKCNDLKYHCKQIIREEMNLLMDRARSDRSIWVKSEEVPLDFRHKNAFKFLNNKYDDARWVRIEDLFDLRNCNDVLIGKNYFNGAQLKTFIDYWVNCEFDMFRSMAITRNPGIVLDELLDGLLVLVHKAGRKNSTFITLAKSASEARKNNKLCIRVTRSDILLTSSAPHEKVQKCGEIIKRDWKEYEILKILERKQSLENQLKEYEVKELPEGKEKITAEIKELTDELTKLNVVFKNERATLIV